MASTLFSLIKLPFGSTVTKSTVTKLGTEIAEYVTHEGKAWKQVAYSSKNQGARKLALQGYKQEVGSSKRIYGFNAPFQRDENGLPLKAAWTAAPKDVQPLFLRLGFITEAGGTQGEVVQYARKLADYWKLHK